MFLELNPFNPAANAVVSLALPDGARKEVLRGPILEFAVHPEQHRLALLRLDSLPLSIGQVAGMTGTVSIRDASGKEEALIRAMPIGAILTGAISSPCRAAPRGVPRTLLWAVRE